MKLRQFFCVHWFDEQPLRQYAEYGDIIIACQQREYLVTVQPRVCSKCGFEETRRIGEPVYQGWN